jgi:hypothetical protein
MIYNLMILIPGSGLDYTQRGGQRPRSEVKELQIKSGYRDCQEGLPECGYREFLRGSE